MRSVVICEPVRTPVGRFGGVLSRLTAAELATTTLRSLVQRTRLEEGSVDDVVLGHCYPSGEAPAIGRIAALDAGLGVGVPGVQIDRRCGSGLQAVLYAAMQVSTGSARLVVAGGVESMSQVEHYALGLRTGVRAGGIELMDRLDRARITAGGRDHPVPGGMLETAENLRKKYAITGRPLLLIASKVSESLVATAAEYAVGQIFTEALTMKNLGGRLANLILAEGMVDDVRATLIEVGEKRQEGDLKGALSLLQKTLAKHPTNLRLKCEAGETLLAMDEAEKALALLEGMDKTKPPYLRGMHLYGRALLKLGRYPDA